MYIRKEVMSVCITCEKSTDLVYSGVDGLALEITWEQLGKICYQCAWNQHCLAMTGMSTKEFEESLYGVDSDGNDL